MWLPAWFQKHSTKQMAFRDFQEMAQWERVWPQKGQGWESWPACGALKPVLTLFPGELAKPPSDFTVVRCFHREQWVVGFSSSL